MGDGGTGEVTAEMWGQKGLGYPSQAQRCHLSFPSFFSLSPPHPQWLS